MKATTREDLNLKEEETMCEKCVHENICRREQCGEPFYCNIAKAYCYEERPHGEWIYKDMKGQFCSVCDKQSVWKFNFCPNCGADMRKKVRKNEQMDG